MKKNKNIAGFLALFFGWFGAHRFYLGQRDKGLTYAIFGGIILWTARLKLFLMPIMMLIALIDAIVLFAMDQRRFDEKYNGIPYDRKDRSTDFERRKRSTDFERPNTRVNREANRRKRAQTKPKFPNRKAQAQSLVFKKRGKKRYEEYDFQGAIKDFEQSLEFVPNDIASHFNLACVYSLTEVKDKAFYHLDEAVRNGLRNLKKIKGHPALAYLRIQPEFETFEKNKYRLPSAGEAVSDKPEEDLLNTEPDLLDQLNKLGELRKKGFLTEKEFEARKRELLT